MLGFMLRRPHKSPPHSPQISRSLVFVTGLFLVVNFPPQTLESLIGGRWCVDVEKPARSFLVIVSCTSGAGGRDGGRVGSCKGQSSTNMSQNDARHTHFLSCLINSQAAALKKSG